MSQILNLKTASLLAQTINLKPTTGVPGDLQNLTISQLLGGLLALALIVAAIIFFFMLVIGGIRWTISGGDKAQTEAARSQITAALVGLVIVFGAWAITNLVGSFFGFDIFTLTIPDITTLGQ